MERWDGSTSNDSSITVFQYTFYKLTAKASKGSITVILFQAEKAARPEPGFWGKFQMPSKQF